MKVKINPSSCVGGDINAITSKSHAHRLLICSALCKEQTLISCTETSEDITATARCLNALGAEIANIPQGFQVTPMSLRFYKNSSCNVTEKIEPLSLDFGIGKVASSFPDDHHSESDDVISLDCGESGSTYRFLFPLACCTGKSSHFRLRGRLSKRPMDPLFSQLESHGVTISGKGTELVTTRGLLTGGKFSVPGNVSSQFISGLIFALPLLKKDSTIEITGKIESQSYINITLSVVKQFGIEIYMEENLIRIPGGQKYRSPGTVTAEGDWSNSAFWLCAAASAGQQITCNGLSLDSFQGDKKVCDVLEDFGVKIERYHNRVALIPGRLKGIIIDVSDIPDLVPALAVVACKAAGITRIINGERLKLKESDRLKSVAQTLNALGGQVEETPDGLIIYGNPDQADKAQTNIQSCGRAACRQVALSGGTVDSWGDHRIVMMAAVASVLCDKPVIIENAQAVNKSYPGFFRDFQALGAIVEVLEA